MDEINVSEKRLDTYLFESGMCQSRSLAKRLIVENCIKVNGISVSKPSLLVSSSDCIEICDSKLTKYVSRGALKLEFALDKFNISASEKVCLDIGASTGGFTDVLLQRGASRVYAVENGNGQLHEKLRDDIRVVSLENTNARSLSHDLVPICDLVVMDVSFASQVLFYKTVSEFLAVGGYFVSLIKPQFEAGKQHLNKKGIVKDPKIHNAVVNNIVSQASDYGFDLVGICPSPIEGGDGNKEFLAVFTFKDRSNT